MSTDNPILTAAFSGRVGTFDLNVEIRFPANGITILFGPSGCGKTTLLRCLAGIERLDHGAFVLNGVTWQDEKTFLPAHKRSIGYVFQQANLFSHLSVRANLKFGMKRISSERRQRSEKRFDALIALLGLGKLLDRSPARLSGGEKQRVAIARALLTNPDLLLMDEPLSALDIANKREILPYLERLKDELSIPVLYVTHAPDEAARLADHLIVMERGGVLANGPANEVMARLDLPMARADDAGVAISATITEIDADWHLARVSFDGGDLWVRDPRRPIGTRVRVMVRASDVSLALEPSPHSSIMNRLPATVEHIAEGEHPAVVMANIKAGETALIARLTARSAHMLDLQKGQQLYAQIKSVAIIE